MRWGVKGARRAGRRLLAIGAVFPLLVLTVACGTSSSEEAGPSTGTPYAPTGVVTATPTSSTPVPTTSAPTTPGALAFAPPDPVEGVGDVREALIGGNLFHLEVARTREETRRGLMDRPSLPEDAAMLFIYERERSLVFWMKDTLIPLDILFLDAEGTVVDVQTMHPQPGATDAVLRRYPSAHPARYAIEMNAGLADEYGITPGDQVLFR